MPDTPRCSLISGVFNETKYLQIIFKWSLNWSLKWSSNILPIAHFINCFRIKQTNYITSTNSMLFWFCSSNFALLICCFCFVSQTRCYARALIGSDLVWLPTFPRFLRRALQGPTPPGPTLSVFSFSTRSALVSIQKTSAKKNIDSNPLKEPKEHIFCLSLNLLRLHNTIRSMRLLTLCCFLIQLTSFY